MTQNNYNESRKMIWQKPLIGITMRHDTERGRFYLAMDYSEAIIAAGGVPVHITLSDDDDYLSEIAMRLDGVLLPGSASDVDPNLYAQEPDVKLGMVHPRRDSTDLKLLKFVEKRRLPLLAICYGMQVWNVARKGTLVQDVASVWRGAIKHQQEGVREHRSHNIKLATDSRLYDVVNRSLKTSGVKDVLAVNSHHHQGVSEVGENLRAVAWAGDGLVEAIEETRAGRWGIGVQWHPEVDWCNDEVSRELFADFVNATRIFQGSVEREKDFNPVSV